MSSRPTPPRLGFRVPPPPAPRDPAAEGDDEATLRPGDLLDGRYQIEDQVGEGGVGVVYRALQLKLHRRVAVKLLHQESDEQQRPRFEREAVTLAALSHPNIVSLQDYGHTRGRPFLVMELLAGRTLRELVDSEGALSVPRALALTRQMLHALAYANSLGIVHRDLKPANLLVQALPAYEHVKILDFGFVKLLPGSYLDRGVQLSRVGFTFGTPAYMSPEHATGGEVDGRSDLYSTGILLFEMLTGSKPFEGELPDLIRHHLSTPVPKLSDRRPELADRQDLQALIDRALAKPREKRFANAGEFLQAIDDLTVSSQGQPLQAGTMVHGGPAQSIDLELKRLATAVQRFGRIAFATFKERAGPAVERAWMKVSALALQLWVWLQAQARAGSAWVQSRLQPGQRRLVPHTSEPTAFQDPAAPAASDVPQAPGSQPPFEVPAAVVPAAAAPRPVPSTPPPVPVVASKPAAAAPVRSAVDAGPGHAATLDLSDPQVQASVGMTSPAKPGLEGARGHGKDKRS